MQSQYHITHQTRYRYSEPVAICQNQLRMMPRSITSRVAEVVCHWTKTRVEPQPDHIQEHTDYFGNRVVSFSIESLHSHLDVRVESEVTVVQKQRIAELPSPSWEDISAAISNRSDPDWLEAQEYVFDSPRIERQTNYGRYASESFAAGRPIIEAALDLTRRIHEDFRYDTTATDVHTTTEEAFRLRAGVCQDFAHVQIACLRSIGIPARYVSGYLRTAPVDGQSRLQGADESHAWVSIYAGSQLGWIDVDPTNALPMDTNHIPICLGRDYSEVSPMHGVVLGGGTTELTVSVDVTPLESVTTP